MIPGKRPLQRNLVREFKLKKQIKSLTAQKEALIERIEVWKEELAEQHRVNRS